MTLERKTPPRKAGPAAPPSLAAARVLAALPLLAALAAPPGAPAQQAADPEAASDASPAQPARDGWFPPSFVVQPVSEARSGVDIGTGPLVVRRDPPAGSGDASPEADVSFGYRVPIYRFAGGSRGGPGLDVGLEAGMLARFALGEGTNGLINSDFRVAFPLGADFGRWEAEVSLVHVSSHVGDDYIEQRPGFDPEASSRNGVEGEVLYRLDPRLRLLGGMDYNWAAVGVETIGGRLGAAFDPPVGSGRFRPIGTIELQATDYNPGLGVTGMVGVGVRTGTGDLRVGLTGHAGPSEMGQFRGYDEEYVGLFVGFVPNVVRDSGAEET